MSFDIICGGCGAPSSPSVGICPFCKSILADPASAGADSPTIDKLNELYLNGKTEEALAFAHSAETNKPELLEDPRFILLYVQTLIESDGPSSKIKSLLTRGLLENPQDRSLLEYQEVVNAKSNLSRENFDIGEYGLTHILKDSPENIHALFLLGSHIFWVDKDPHRALKYLESVYRLRPQFLRSTACLGALYRSLGQPHQAKRLFLECANLEPNKDMREYFEKAASLDD